MHRIVRTFALWLPLQICFCGSVSAQQIESMKLLAPQVGWIATSDRVFWTTTGGAEWKDITPPRLSGKTIASVFFRDISQGWVLVSGGEQSAEGPTFELAATSTAGETWTKSPVKIPDLDPESTTLGGGGSLFFVDSAHGWIDLNVVSSSNFRLGLLVATDDGGKSWHRLRENPSVGGSVYFRNASDGWFVGGPGDQDLFATHDGGNSWQRLSFQSPVEADLALYATYRLPAFEDDLHGLLPVTYGGREGVASAVVVFATSDAGRSWKARNVLNGLTPRAVGQVVPSAVTDSVVIVAEVRDRAHADVMRLRQSSQSPLRANTSHLESGIFRLSFASVDQGWALSGAARLLSTFDGGITWTDITPNEGAAAETLGPDGDAEAQAGLSQDDVTPLLEANVTSTSTSATHTNVRLGFDQCAAQLATTMQTWWGHSAYFDVGAYIGGDSRSSCTVKQPFTSTWLTAVINQGWGVIPLWPGLQAPCTTFPNRFSSTPSTANSQGIAEAQKAATTASNLGLPASVIYYDMEQYSSSQCGSAVTAFINGWTSKLHALGFKAGAYWNVSNVPDLVKASPLPDDIWIAKYDNRATIWGLGSLCDPYSTSSCIGGSAGQLSLWKNGQRIHQYRGPHYETNGGVTVQVDSDLIDAPVTGGNGVKSYTFSYQSFNCNGGSPYGINNNGEVVGSYSGSNGTHGFLYSSSLGCKLLRDYPGANSTQPLSINNAHQIVGWYADSSGIHGFLYDYSKDTFTSINQSGWYHSQANGINDAGQIVGFYNVPNSNFHGFLYYNGTYHSFNVPNSTATLAFSLNGATQIAGYYIDSTGAVRGFINQLGNFTLFGAPSGYRFQQDSLGLNNNSEMAGEYNDSSGHLSGYFYQNGKFQTVAPSGATSTWVNGINDYTVGDKGRMVVQWDSSTNAYGSIATSK